MLNSVTIGVEKTYRIRGDQAVLDLCRALENVFLFIYTVELLMRFCKLSGRIYEAATIPIPRVR